MPTAIEQYKQVNTHSAVQDANAHKLIAMLLAGALDKIAAAKGCMLHKDLKGKGINIGFAISIIDGLQTSLDLEKGGEIASNLFRLYQYMMEVLLQANLHNKVEQLDEVTGLLCTIKEGWDGIEKEANALQETT